MIESPLARLAGGTQPARFQPPTEVFRVEPPKRNATASIAPIRAPLALTPGFSPVVNPLDSSVDGSPVLRPMHVPFNASASFLPPLRISEESNRTKQYSMEEFLQFKDERCHTPGSILEWAINRYHESHLVGPIHLTLIQKENEDERQLGGQCKKGRLRSVRQIQHKVMSILSRITAQSFDKLRDELLELPLRQSSDTELREIVKIFFEKAVKEIKFSDLYAKLALELCKQTEAEKAMPKEEQQKLLASRMRTGLLHACQEEFGRPLQLQDSDLVDAVTGESLPDELVEQKRTQLKKRLVGNIKFVGELYLMGLLSNAVMESIFKQLIMDFDTENPCAKDDYVFDVFATLFTTTVLKFLGANPDSVGRIGKKVEEIEKAHPVARVRFQMLDILELRKNNWKRGGPVLRSTQSLDRMDSGAGSSQASSPTSAHPPHTPTGRNGHSSNDPTPKNRRGTPAHLDPNHVQTAGTPTFQRGSGLSSKASSTLPTPLSNTGSRTGAYRAPGSIPLPASITTTTTTTTTRTTTTSTNISTTNTPSKNKPPTALNIAPTTATLVSSAERASMSGSGSPCTQLVGQGMGARRQSSGSKLSPSHSAASGPQSPITLNARTPTWGYTSTGMVDGKKVKKAVEGYIEQYRTEPEEVLKALNEIERKELIVIMVHWIHLCVGETRRMEDRVKLPALFGDILDRCENPAKIVLTSSDLLTTIKEAISYEVEGGSYDNCPRLFANWAMIVTEAFKLATSSIKDGKMSPKMVRVLLILNAGTFTRWLGCLVSKHDGRAIHTAVRDLSVASKEIIKMCDALAEGTPTKVLQYAILNRFRILPYLLKLEGGRIRTPTTPQHQAADLSPTLHATDAYQQCFALVGDDAELSQFKRVMRGEQNFCAIAPSAIDAVTSSGNANNNVTLVQTAMKLTSATLALLYPPKTETPKISSEQSFMIIKDTLDRMPDRMRGAAEAAVVTEMIYFFCCDINKAINPGYNSLANSMATTPMKSASMSPSRSFDGPPISVADDTAALGAACECFRRWVEKDVIRRQPVLELLGGIAPPKMPSTPGTPPRAFTCSDLDGSFALPGPDMAGPFAAGATSQRSLAGSPTGMGPQREDSIGGPSTPLISHRAGTPVGANSCPGTPNVSLSASPATYFFDEGEMLVRNLNAVSTLHWHKIIARLQKA